MSPRSMLVLQSIAHRPPGISTGSWYRRWAVVPGTRGYGLRPSQQRSVLTYWRTMGYGI
jgi:hypothetical protein